MDHQLDVAMDDDDVFRNILLAEMILFTVTQHQQQQQWPPSQLMIYCNTAFVV
jgi:hypothetical protein